MLNVEIVAPEVVAAELRAVLRDAGLSIRIMPGVTDVAPDAVVLCCEASRGDLVRAVTDTRRGAPDVLVVVVASDDMDLRAGRDALEAGAAGLVMRRDVKRALVPTLEAAAVGQACFPLDLEREAQRPLLSMREKQVLGMVVLGFSNGEIAGRLFVADTTVKSHLNSAFRKLGVRNRGEATAVILDPTRGLGTGILTIPVADSA